MEIAVEDAKQCSARELDVVSLRSAELETGAAPTRILIAPWGDVESTRGEFFVDGQAVAATIEQFREHGTDIPIDFEHQTLGGSYASPDGLAPAAGWIKNLIGIESVGLMADVKWTELGLEHLQKKQYRYLSPVALIRKSDRRLVGLHSAALTNKPAIVGMEALVNREDTPTPTVPIAQASARGSLDQSVEEQSMIETLEKLRKQLDLDQQNGARRVLVAASERIAELERREEDNSAEARVAEAMAAGKLTEAQRDWALKLALSDAQSFDAWSAAAPVVVNLGRTAAPSSDDALAQSSQLVATRARSEYRSESVLQALTSEEAYVQQAMKESIQ
jgi:phage I-like protein